MTVNSQNCGKLNTLLHLVKEEMLKDIKNKTIELNENTMFSPAKYLGSGKAKPSKRRTRQRQKPKSVPFETEKQRRECWLFEKINKIAKNMKEQQKNQRKHTSPKSQMGKTHCRRQEEEETVGDNSTHRHLTA